MLILLGFKKYKMYYLNITREYDIIQTSGGINEV
jgi:hypothetical protein